MAKSLVTLFFVALALPLQAAAGPSSPGWQTPQVGSKLFYVTRFEKAIDGTSYRGHTAFDIVKQDTDSVTIITGSGEPLTLDTNQHQDMILSRVPWDLANNIPTGRDLPEKRFTRYYHFMTGMLTRWWFFILMLTISAGVAFVVGAADEGRLLGVSLCTIFMLVVLGFGAFIGNGYLRYIETYDTALPSQYRLDETHLLPVHYSFIDPELSARVETGLLYHLGRLLWVPIFLLLHLCFLISLPGVIRGLHYLFVPHPAEKHLVSALAGQSLQKEATVASVGRGSMASPPPAWVSKNQKQRVDALKDRFKAETGLLNAVIEWARKKEELRDK